MDAKRSASAGEDERQTVEIRLDHRSGRHAVGSQIRIAQQELGELLGLTRATVNTALREFERQGLLTRRYGMIELCDPVGLQRVALD